MLRKGTEREELLAQDAEEAEQEEERGMPVNMEVVFLYVRYYILQGGYQSWDGIL